MADHDKQDDADGEKHESEAKESSGKHSASGNGAAAAAAPSAPAAVALAGGHGAAAAHEDHGLAHTTPVSLLVGILAALMVLTILTVSVTSIDLGAQGNLVVAMVIATIKAALVVAFFMHLVWDKKLHLILFLTSVLFLILFLSLSVNDRGEYQPDLDQYQATESAK
ncbi:MAG TPA: cytochrome C oxidase subunit IV family protein [Polyangiaceae bacterium]|nr:cytochrome C oxidase subunit IV family protein [Polyangiaceae bacterium]